VFHPEFSYACFDHIQNWSLHVTHTNLVIQSSLYVINADIQVTDHCELLGQLNVMFTTQTNIQLEIPVTVSIQMKDINCSY